MDSKLDSGNLHWNPHTRFIFALANPLFYPGILIPRFWEDTSWNKIIGTWIQNYILANDTHILYGHLHPCSWGIWFIFQEAKMYSYFILMCQYWLLFVVQSEYFLHRIIETCSERYCINPGMFSLQKRPNEILKLS